ncbi:MAG: PIN domain-containing protein [Nitrospirae bacterium]|nr:PIN domain-containing protein [Nitrospirota bacterium]
MDNKPGKVYVLDTTVLIYDPDITSKTAEADWIIPLVVIRELDGLKNSDKELVAKAARQIARTLDRLSSYGDLVAGVKLQTGRTLRVFAGYESVDALASDADNKILGAALSLKNSGEDVTLFTTDTNMRTVARAYRVKAEYTPFFDIAIPPVTRNTGKGRARTRYPLNAYQRGRGMNPFRRWGISGVLMRLCFVVFILGSIALFLTPKAYYDTVAMITGFALLGAGSLMIFRWHIQMGRSEGIRYRSPDFFLDPNWSSDPGNVWHNKEDQ